MSKGKFAFLLILLLALIIIAGGVLAAGQAFVPSVDWWTIDSGGGVSIGGNYSLAGTMSQPDASAAMTGDSYSLIGGYWGMADAYTVFLPLVMR